MLLEAWKKGHPTGTQSRRDPATTKIAAIVGERVGEEILYNPLLYFLISC